ncbi:hypothetical protein T281_12890 [Rhodomicrobium udaipurense JA643]|uniref:Uncharacterized protein n=1 Tax=Rhodomicrobium udaipurense TaxID=1202716 RepID=A0A8I1GEF6_9HYPH|nr:hypothetical protein [Rhodomicrobium udaipurense]KAI94105.1 hypothetical protein T281_12890 [Rhodomicrobium udaipurense JA643]MBJ7543269.1 hypothetical protein [Rhodomicrobium udaipurense]
MPSSLPSADSDYQILDIDTKLTLAFWNAALGSVGARLRAAEAVRADFEALINTGTGQALAVISANVEPQLATLTAAINQLKADVAEAEDAIATLIGGAVPMEIVTGLAAALNTKATQADLAALATTVAAKATQADLEALAAAVGGKALQADLAALATTVAAKATQADFEALATAVSEKAAQAELAVVVGRGLVNKFRNGSFAIAQRGTSGSVTAGATAYTLDGWQVSAAGAAVAWSQVWNTNIAGATIRLQRSAAGLTVCTLQQRIESYLAAELLTYAKEARPVTVQFVVYNGTASAITPKIAAGYATARDNFGTVTADLAATNLQTIAAGATGIVSYTFIPSVNIANGLQIQLQFGSALNSTSGYVHVGRADIRATPGIAPGLNSAPPPAELRDPMSELALCQRYFCKSHAALVAPGSAVGGGACGIVLTTNTSGSGANISSPFPVTMGGLPTLTIYDSAGAAGKVGYLNGSLWASGGSIGAAGATSYGVRVWCSQNTNGFEFDYAASWEL